MKRYWFRTMILLCIALAMRQFSGAQILVESGATFPKAPKQYTWFEDTVKQQLWQFVDQWKIRQYETMKVEICHNLLIAEGVRGMNVLQRDGTSAISSPSEYYCADSMTLVFSDDTYEVEWANPDRVPNPTKFSFFDHSGKLLRYYHQRNYIHEIQWKGGLAWCLPGFDLMEGKIEVLRVAQHQNWGVFAGNGRWVIPPIYDLPFTFVNGIAEVQYYGRTLKINENGEEVK